MDIEKFRACHLGFPEVTLGRYRSINAIKHSFGNKGAEYQGSILGEVFTTFCQLGVQWST